MHVILNVDAITPPLTGIGRYALELVRGFRDHPEIDDIKYFSAYRWMKQPDTEQTANRLLAVARKHLPMKKHALSGYFWLRQRLFNHHVSGRFGSYLLHSPNYILMRHSGPTVATIHDFSWVHFPEFHPKERIALMQREMPRTFAEGTRFITDSEFVKQEAIKIAGVPAEKIRVVPLGVDPAFRPMPQAECETTLQRYGLAGKSYLLAVATIEPRKNLARLLRAYASLPGDVRARYPLVLVGVRGWHASAMEKMMAPMTAAGELIPLGYVAEADLPALYACAHAFAFVSLHEGFGLPLLEAMACGIPTVTSNVSSLPEVSGDAAWLVDPTDEEQIRDGLLRSLQDDKWRSMSRQEGLARARQFTWTQCVAGTLEAYKEAMAA